jgi:hypothetical protein
VSARLITLERWAELTYGDAAPHVNTLRRWAREVRIYPAPEKHGRTYYVRPEARYVEFKSEPEAPAEHSAPRAPGRRLIDRISL